MNISRITDNYAVSPQIKADEVAYCAELGFVAIICNRPDGEEAGQVPAVGHGVLGRDADQQSEGGVGLTRALRGAGGAVQRPGRRTERSL